MGDARDNYTVAIGLQLMIDQDFKNTYYKQFLAGSVVVAVPITLLFLKMQKYYVEGVTVRWRKGLIQYTKALTGGSHRLPPILNLRRIL